MDVFDRRIRGAQRSNGSGIPIKANKTIGLQGVHHFVERTVALT